MGKFFTLGAAGTVVTLTGDAGGAISPNGAGDITLAGGTNIGTTGAGNTITFNLEATIGVALGGTGLTAPTDHSVLLGSGAGAITPLGVAGNGEIPIGSVGADPVLATITAGTDLYVTNGAGSIEAGLTADADMTAVHGWNGCLLETATVLVSEAGGVITLSVTGPATSDLTVCFSDGFYDWDCTPADEVTLTAGSDTAPQINYVYLLQSTKTLTADIGGWPATEYAAIATVLCQSAASLGTDGPYKLHAYTDHVVNPADQGHISMINHWIRHQNATWVSGVAPTLTITPQGAAADNVIFTSGAGVVAQLHDHVFPAFAGTPDVCTVNEFGNAYNVVTDLNALLTDSANVSMSGKYFTLVMWGVINEVSGESKLMINLPGGSYNTQAQLLADSSRYANFSIPENFVGTGFLIYQMNLRHQVAASGTWTSISNINLRGLFPSLAAGGSTAFATEFEDNVFRILDQGDNTKEIAFEASSITTATTRTVTMSDFNINLGSVATNYGTDGAAATPSGGTVTFTGGTNITTSGAGAAVTINLAATIGVSLGGTGLTAPTDHSLLVGSGAGAITPITVGTDGQILVGDSADDPVFANITAGVGVTVTEGAGTLAIESTSTTLKNETGTSYTLIIGDAGKFFTFTNGAAITVTIPTNAAVAFAIGTQIGFMQGGAGQVTLSGAAPPTLKSADNAYTTVKLYSGGYMIKIDTDVWGVFGDLEA